MKKKMILKRISALLCAMIVGIGALNEIDLYYGATYSTLGVEVFKNNDASTSYSVDVSNFPEYASGKPWVIVDYAGYFYLYVLDSTDIPSVGSSDGETPSGVQYSETYYGFYNTTDYANSVCYESRKINGSWNEQTNISRNIGLVNHSYNDELGFFYSNQFDNLNCKFVASNCDIKIMGITVYEATNNHNDDSYDDFSEEYDSTLGYLQNITDKKQVLTDSSGVQDLSSMKKIVTFDSTSTTGINLTSGDYVIRVYGQMAFKKNGTNEIVNENFPLVHYADYDASSCKFEYNYQALFDLVTNSAENPYNAFDTVFGQIVRSDNTYFQIYNTKTSEYGGYVKSSMGVTSNGEEESLYTTVDDNLEIDDNGYKDYDAPSSAGSGTTWDDAELNDKPIGSSNTDFVDFESSLNSLVSGLASVPKAFGVMFSFLPPWCLNLLAISVGALPLILLYKAFRG